MRSVKERLEDKVSSRKVSPFKAGEVIKWWVLLFSQFLLLLLAFDCPSLILELEMIGHL